MANLVMSQEENVDRALPGDIFHRVGVWAFAVLMIFLGLSGPALGYIRAVEPPAGTG